MYFTLEMHVNYMYLCDMEKKKAVLSVLIEHEVMDKLKRICKAEDRSHAKMLERIIKAYDCGDVEQPVKQEIKQQEPTPQAKPIETPKPLPKQPIPVKKIVTSLTIKDEPKKFNLMEAMANASK